MDAKTFLCISCEYKGVDFLRTLKAEGHRVFLVTGDDEREKPWPQDVLDDIFYVKANPHCIWNLEDFKSGLAHFMRHHKVDRIVALDDFDVERTATLREEFRFPGMGETTARYFRDKLAMRLKAEEAGIPVPAFSALFHDEDVKAYAARTSPPWVVKPRFEASAIGISKVHSADELLAHLDTLGDRRHRYLVEQFKPGDVYHVDSISSMGKVIFTRVSKYLSPPLTVSQGGGIFRSQTVPYGEGEDTSLRQLNATVMKAFGMQHSASHSEFIRDHESGTFYFLETSSRVGGAHLAEMVEAASGLNLWSEWARLESAMSRGVAYELPQTRREHAGIIVSLSRHEHADYGHFDDPEVCWTLNKDHHVGVIVRSESHARISELLDKYAGIVASEFHATAPPRDVTHN